MLLKIHAWIYRTFGIFTKYARKKEREYTNSLGDISDVEKEIFIGCWQAEKGFYRTHKQVMKGIKKRYKK